MDLQASIEDNEKLAEQLEEQQKYY